MAFIVVLMFFRSEKMSDNISFEERVKQTIIECAPLYKQYYTDYEYMIFSEAFTISYCTISAKEDNFLHLLGVNSTLSPQEFFNKSLDGTLTISDFDFYKRGQVEKAVKGTVRRKINVIKGIFRIFDNAAYVEEDFTKNNIRCSFATSDNNCTIGFTLDKPAKPKTLLKGNELNKENCRPIDVVIRRKVGTELFDTITYGTTDNCLKYRELITKYSTKELVEKIF